jgi:hypothetical protein
VNKRQKKERLEGNPSLRSFSFLTMKKGGC